MIKKLSAVLIWSERHRELADWYKEKLGLNPIQELNHPQDTGVGFDVGGVFLWIGKHSKVHRTNQDPHRHMFNLSVDSVSKTYEKLIENDVRFYAKPFKSPVEELYFATFYDLDGNMIQLVGGK